MKKRLVCLALCLALLCSLTVPAMALTGLNTFATARFARSFAVYSGPGLFYMRANEGKATYGGGGVARVYGVTGDWVLIGYQLGSGNYRIGYIEKAAMDGISDVKGIINYNLVFDAAKAWTTRDCPLTDDPIIKNEAVYTIPTRTAVTALATMGTEWTYVEVLGTSSYMRGFVRSSNLSFSSPYAPTPTSTATVTNPPVYYYYSTPVPTTIPNTFYHDTWKGDWLPSYQIVRFNQSAPVYSGPATYYFRANNGKATMGGGTCRLYGVENGWALIGYELSNGAFRIGYVEADKLPEEGLHIPYLDLRYVAVATTAACSLTDDIVKYQPSLLEIPAGTPVLYLGKCDSMGMTWAYVEVMAQSNLMRGFIPAYVLDLSWLNYYYPQG